MEIDFMPDAIAKDVWDSKRLDGNSLRRRACAGALVMLFLSSTLVVGWFVDESFDPTPLSAEELRVITGSIFTNGSVRYDVKYDAALLEAVRRGGKEWLDYLDDLHATLSSSKLTPWENEAITQDGASYNLEVLTALRRLQGTNDPLRIYVDCPSPLIITSTVLPSLDVKIRNVDGEEKDAGFMFGGDYRTGRQARWRISLRDAEGTEIPVVSQLGFFGGGLHSEGTLNFAEAWETTLYLGSYVENPMPGKYTLQVQYHNVKTIAGCQSVSNFIVSVSEPIPVVVRPLLVSVSDQERRKTVEAIERLPDKGPVKVVVGPYGRWAHDFVSQESPQGELLELGMPAAPALCTALNNPDCSAELRAQIFSILYTITGQNDPRRCSSLGSYEYQQGSTFIWGGIVGEPKNGGGPVMSKGSGTGKISIEDQKALIARWNGWRKALVIK